MFNKLNGEMFYATHIFAHNYNDVIFKCIRFPGKSLYTIKSLSRTGKP